MSTATLTNDDIHRRREGEPLGYVPEVGDRIRYALRHSPWDINGEHVEGWPANAPQGPWSEPVSVLDVFETETSKTKYTLKDAQGVRSWIDLDWWITELCTEDGALW